MDVMEELLRQILQELQEMNKKLVELNGEVEKITGYGTADLLDVKNELFDVQQAITDINSGGFRSLEDVYDKLEEISGKL